MFHDVVQNTHEWDLLRVGKITSSKLSTVMANYGKAFGEPAKKYASEIALGQITGKVSANGYTNSHMERGHEEEVTPLETSLFDRTNHRQWNRRGRGVAELLYVCIHLLIREPHSLLPCHCSKCGLFLM